MNLYKFAASCAVLMASVTSVSMAYAVDILHMANGDRYRGEVIDRDRNGYVYFKTEYGAFLQLHQNDIRQEQSSEPEYQAQIKAPDQFVSVAEQNYAQASWQKLESFSLADMQEPLPAVVQNTQGASASVYEKQPPATDKTKADKKTLWGYAYKGEVNFGGNIQSGNSDKSSVKFDGKTELKKEKHRLTFGGEINHAKDEGDVTVDNMAAKGGYDYFFAPKWYWKNALSFKTDDIQDLDARIVLGSGLGYQIHESDIRNAKASFTVNYIRENYSTAGDDETDIGGAWDFAYDQKFWEEKIKLYHEHDVLFPFDDVNAFVLGSTTGVKLPLVKGISSSFELDFDWDNEPATGKSEEDTTYSVKMGYEW